MRKAFSIVSIAFNSLRYSTPKLFRSIHFHCNPNQHKITKAEIPQLCFYFVRSRSQSQQHIPWHLIIMPYLTVFGCHWVVLNRICLMEAPLSGQPLASVWIPWKKQVVKLIFAAFRDNLTFEVSASTQESRQEWWGWKRDLRCYSSGSSSKEAARYCLHDKAPWSRLQSCYSQRAQRWNECGRESRAVNICSKEKQQAIQFLHCIPGYLWKLFFFPSFFCQ